MARRVRTYFVCGLALVYAYANAVAVYAGETRFWEDRRQAARRLQNQGPTPDLGLPESSLTTEQRQLLAQLPAARQMDFRVTEPATLSGSLTAGRASGRSFEQADLAHIPTWISSLVLPYAAVRDIYIAPKPGAPLIVQVQDAHGIEEAQRNIAGLIESLRQERGISLVGLEGAAGAFALDPFRAYPDPAVTKAIADFFLKDATITGAEYAGLTSTAPPLLWGIEDQTRYEENIQAFQDSLKNKPAVGAFLGPLEAAAAALKEKIYSPALKEFDKRCRAYQDRDAGLGAYVGYLMSAYPGDKTRFPNLRLLTEALTWEENLDFKRVEKDRLKLVEALARRLPEKSLNVLVQQSLLYRAGRMTYGDYYRFLRSLCAANRIPITEFGSLGDYITYVLIAERINRNDLLDELFRMETSVQDALAATIPEKRLVEASRSLILLEKLTSHAMTPADWAAYQSNRKQVLSAPLELKVAAMDLSAVPSPLGRGTGEAGGEGEISVPSRPPDFETLLTPFENFCSYALERNNALVDNLLAKMTAEKTPAAILVAGGFHTDGLTQVFRRKDVSYVVVTPKIADIPKENKYLDVFARDAVPLEKLFEGDKINLVAAQVNALSSLSTVRSHYYRALTAVFRHLLKPLSSKAERALDVLMPGVVEEESRGNTVSVSFQNEKSPRVFRTGGRTGLTVEWELAGEKVSTRVEVVRPGPIAGFYVSLRRRVAALDWRALFGPSKEKPVAAVSGRREIEDLAASILPTYDGVGPNFIAYAHFWEWVYQYPILGLFVRPVVRWLQPYFFRDLKNSQVAEYQLLFQELSKLKPSWEWVGVTRLGTILNVLGSIAIIGGFISGFSYVMLPAASVWIFASAYGFSVAHVKKNGGQKVAAFFFGVFLASISILPVILHASGLFPVEIPRLGYPSTVQWFLIALLVNIILHFSFNLPVRWAKRKSMRLLAEQKTPGRLVAWLAQRSTMSIFGSNGVGSTIDEALLSLANRGGEGVSSRGPPETRLREVLRREMGHERAVFDALGAGKPKDLVAAVTAMTEFDEVSLIPLVEDRLTSGGKHVRLSDERCLEDLINPDLGRFDLARFAPPIMDLNSIGGQELGNEALDLLENVFQLELQATQSAEIDIGSYRESTHFVLRGISEDQMREIVPRVWTSVLGHLLRIYRTKPGLDPEKRREMVMGLEKLKNKFYASHVGYELPRRDQLRGIYDQRQLAGEPYLPQEYSEESFIAYLSRGMAGRVKEYKWRAGVNEDEEMAKILAEDDFRQDRRLLIGLRIREGLDQAKALSTIINATTELTAKASLLKKRSDIRRQAVADAMEIVLEMDLKTMEAVDAIEKIGDGERNWLGVAAREAKLLEGNDHWTDWYLPASLTRASKHFLNKALALKVLKALNKAYANGRGKAIPSGEYPTGRIPRLGNMMDELREGHFGLEPIRQALGLYEEALKRNATAQTAENARYLSETLQSLENLLKLYRRMKGVMIERAVRDLRFHGIERQSGATHMNLTYKFSKAFAYKEECFPDISAMLTDGTLEAWRESLIKSGDDELRRLGENISTRLLLAKKSGGDEMSMLASLGVAGIAPVAMEYNGLNAWNNAIAKKADRKPIDVRTDGEFHRGLEGGLLDSSADVIRNGHATPEQLRDFLEKFNEHIRDAGEIPFPLTVKPPDELRDEEGRMPLLVTREGFFAVGRKGVYKVDASTWKVTPEVVPMPKSPVEVPDHLRATITIGDPVLGEDPVQALRRMVIPVNDIQKYQRPELNGQLEIDQEGDRFSGGVKTVDEVRAEQTRREHERREPAASAKSPKTLSLPFWTRVFGPVADTAVFKVGAAPWLELLLLPGIAMVLSHFLPMWFAIPVGSLIVSALHGLPPVGQRGPPGQTWFDFVVRAVMAAFIAGMAFHAGGFSPEMLSAVLHHPLTASSWVSLLPTLLGAGLLHMFFNFWMVLAGGPTLSMSRKRPPSGRFPAVSSPAPEPGVVPGEAATLQSYFRKGLDIGEVIHEGDLDSFIGAGNVHIMDGHIPAPPKRTEDLAAWERQAVSSRVEVDGKLHVYVHPSLLDFWRNRERAKRNRERAKSFPGYLKYALLVTLLRENAARYKIPAERLSAVKLDVAGLDALYQDPQLNPLRIGRILQTRAKLIVGKTFFGENQRDLLNYMLTRNLGASPEADSRREFVLKSVMRLKQAYVDGELIIPTTDPMAEALDAAELRRSPEAVLAAMMIHLPPDQLNKAEAILNKEIDSRESAWKGQKPLVLESVLTARWARSAALQPYDPKPDQTNAPEYFMDFLRPHLGGKAPGEPKNPEDVLLLAVIHDIHALEADTDEQRRKVLDRKIIQIWASLMERWGFPALSTRLKEDAFRIMEPDHYAQEMREVEEETGMSLQERHEKLSEVSEAAEKALVKSQKSGEVTTRPKSYFSRHVKKENEKARKKKGEEPKKIKDTLGMMMVLDMGKNEDERHIPVGDLSFRANLVGQDLEVEGKDLEVEGKDLGMLNFLKAYGTVRLASWKGKDISPTPSLYVTVGLYPEPGKPPVDMEVQVMTRHAYEEMNEGVPGYWKHGLTKLVYTLKQMRLFRKNPDAFLASQRRLILFARPPKFDEADDIRTPSFSQNIRNWVNTEGPNNHVLVRSPDGQTFTVVKVQKGGTVSDVLFHRAVDADNHGLAGAKVFVLDGNREWVELPGYKPGDPVPNGAMVEPVFVSQRRSKVSLGISEAKNIRNFREDELANVKEPRARLKLRLLVQRLSLDESDKATDIRRLLTGDKAALGMNPLKSRKARAREGRVASIAYQYGFVDRGQRGVIELYQWLAILPEQERKDRLAEIEGELDLGIDITVRALAGKSERNVQIRVARDRPGLWKNIERVLLRDNADSVEDTSVEFEKEGGVVFRSRVVFKHGKTGFSPGLKSAISKVAFQPIVHTGKLKTLLVRVPLNGIGIDPEAFIRWFEMTLNHPSYKMTLDSYKIVDRTLEGVVSLPAAWTLDRPTREWFKSSIRDQKGPFMGVEVKFIRRFVDQLAEDLRDVVFPVGARSVDVHERSGVLLVALLALLVWPASHILAVVIGFMPILFIVYELRDWSDRRAGRVEKPALIQVDLNVLWSRWRASRSAKAKAPLEEPIPLASGTAREAASELLKVLAAEQPEAGPQLEPIRTEILQAETMGQVKFIPSGELAKAPEMQHPLFPACGIQTQEDVDVAVQRFEELPAQWVRAVFVVAKTQELAASAEEKLKAAGAKRVILVLWSSVADSSSGRPVLDDVIMGTDRPGDVREAILAGLKADAESDKSIRIPLIAFADWEVRSPLLKIVAFLQRLLGGRPLLIHLETPEEVRKILVIRSSA